ncbi:FAD-dependent monooxygenase, partial [Kineococcus glutinatus]|uniref:FAD-dependent monooxygenase n=1 Tax=Kineococcus glutinatus TaxID=1070872 RepID=UPI0031E5B7BC
VLACRLAAAGVDVRVLDAAAAPDRTSRALGVQPRGAEVLDRTGALGDLPARGVRLERVVVDLGGRTPVRLELARAQRHLPTPGFIASQADVEAALRERLAALGVAVRWGHAVTAAAQDGAGVDVELSGGDGSAGGVRCGWLVGCDGAHSAVRGLAGIAFPGVQVVERFLLADVRADLPLPRDAVSVWLRPEGMLGAFPLRAAGPGLWRLMAPAAADRSGGRDAGDAAPAELADRLTAVAGIPAGAVRSAAWTSTFRIHRRLADRFRAGRVLLAGDAAHVHSPLGGQGMNTGLGDAENLAWKLALVAGGRAHADLLDTYEAERRPVAAGVLRATTGLTRTVVGGTPAARLLRDHLLVPLLGTAPVQQLVARESSQLTTTYRRGPLGGGPGRWAPRDPRPGDRVPDGPCRREDGTGTRLHAELRAGWALVLPAGG